MTEPGSHQSNNKSERIGDEYPQAEIEEREDRVYRVRIQKTPFTSARFDLKAEEVAPVREALRSVETDDDQEADRSD